MKHLLVVVIMFKCAALAKSERDRMIIWNVGQGSWATFMRAHSCEHFDMGGERLPPLRLLHKCRTNHNELNLSHMDWDHISFISQWRRFVKHFCLTRMPRDFHRAGAAKKRMLARVPLCSPHLSARREIEFNMDSKQANALSRVYVSRGFLFPGDSTTAAEKIWHTHLPAQEIQVLVLGHHGSRTSTGETLLRALSHLRVGVVSARRRRYGHPHSKVVAAFAARKIPLLSTEKWGHLIFEI